MRATAWHSVVAGTCGGVIGLTLSHPLDTIRVQIQVASAQKGIIETAKSITHHGEWRALYRGLLAPCVGYGAIKAVAFATYDASNAFICAGRETDAPLSLAFQVVCGALAGVTSSIGRTPVERVKVVMQPQLGMGSQLPPRAWQEPLRCSFVRAVRSRSSRAFV